MNVKQLKDHIEYVTGKNIAINKQKDTLRITEQIPNSASIMGRVGVRSVREIFMPLTYNNGELLQAIKYLKGEI